MSFECLNGVRFKNTNNSLVNYGILFYTFIDHPYQKIALSLVLFYALGIDNLQTGEQHHIAADFGDKE